VGFSTALEKIGSHIAALPSSEQKPTKLVLNTRA